jgi:hypothetical protein
MAEAPRDKEASADTLGVAFYRDGTGRVVPEGPREPAGRVLRRLGLYTALVLVLLAALDLAVRANFPPERLLPFMEREFASYTVKVTRFRERPAPDVVFLGNSRVHDGLVPSVFAEGLSQRWGRPATAFNLGLMNAKAEEFAALVRSHFPDPPPRRVIFGISGTEFTNTHDFQYASRFLWSAGDFGRYLERTPSGQIELSHVESWLESELCDLWYVFAERDVLRTALIERLQDRMHDWFDAPVPRAKRAVRVRIGRYNRADALSNDGYYDEPGEQSSLARLLARGDDVRIPPYSLDDSSELEQGADFTLMREVIGELQARGCLVAVAEVPPSPWLQEQVPTFHGELFRERMAAFADSVGVLFVPMRPSDTFLIDASYVDANHLNRAGAQRFSRLLLDELGEAGFFDEAP